MPERTTIRGRRVTEPTREGVRDAVSSLLAPHEGVLRDERVVVVPDVHYPYHPSTGLIAHPEVVGAVVAEVQAASAAEVVIGCRAAPVIGTETTVRVLGYPRLADRLGVEVMDLGQADTVPRQVGLRSGSMQVGFPTPFVDATVVVVPTLRTDPTAGLALGMATLARAIRPEASTADEIWGVVTDCSPTVTLLDGSYTYLGEPRASGFLLSGADIVALDGVVAGAVGRAPSYLDTRAVQDLQSVYPVEGLSLEAVAAELPSDSVGLAGPPDRVLPLAYRLYARLAGDAVPPQFLR